MKQEESWEFRFQPELGIWYGGGVGERLESLWKGSQETGKQERVPFTSYVGFPP